LKVGFCRFFQRDEACQGRQLTVDFKLPVDQMIPIHGHQQVDSGVVFFHLARTGPGEKDAGLVNDIRRDAFSNERIERDLFRKWGMPSVH